MDISLIYNESVYLLKTTFIFNLKFDFSNKLKVIIIIKLFYYTCFSARALRKNLVFKIILLSLIKLRFNYLRYNKALPNFF